MREVVLPLNTEFMGPLAADSHRLTPLPFVFLLGNHSSGKSSFINYILQKRVQETGVAPTDDGFTIIAPGLRDEDKDGPSLIGDPDFGFSELRSFGPGLMNRVHLKIRSGMGIDDLMLIDSPGMIDSPTDSISYVGAGRGRRDRGYDFEAVTRWYAERADVILLFFDPDKPGTTGETLSVLTNSLAGMDHKLHIILNKVDQFKKIHDFARAYGSLCWNLSKVIPRKDLPRIYTMYTPVTNQASRFMDQNREVTPFNHSDPQMSWVSSLKDLESTREDVIQQVKRAPARRVDNVVTQLYDSARLVKMHMAISEVVRQDYLSLRRKTVGAAVAVGLTGNLVSLAALYLVPALWGFSATVSGSSLAGAAGMYLYGNHSLQQKASEMSSEEYLDAIFKHVYAKELQAGDEFALSLWTRVRVSLTSAIKTVGPAGLPRVSSRDIKKLDIILEEKVPELRRLAAPLV